MNITIELTREAIANYVIAWLLIGLTTVFVFNLFAGVVKENQTPKQDFICWFAWPVVWAAAIGWIIGRLFGSLSD